MNITFMSSNKKTTKCLDEKDQESQVLQALGSLERKLDYLEELLHQLVLEQEDGEECLDDEESSSM